MSPSQIQTEGDKKVESKAEAEALIPLFSLERVLNQDQGGRRITLLGNIHDQPALLTLERAAFPSEAGVVKDFLGGLTSTTNLGANDVYRWYMSNHFPSSSGGDNSQTDSPPDLKVNLIFPCTPTHVNKYTAQALRYVTETPAVYAEHVKPWIERTQRTPARLDWIYNILDGITEQEDVIFRTADDFDGAAGQANKQGFMLLPDLNWDRKTISGLHLLALVQRRDLWSLRSLKTSDAPWLKRVRNAAVKEAAKYGTELVSRTGGEGTTPAVEEDMLKCYVHYQPTYYHFHIHIVHVMLEAEGTTQSVGKAFALENLISQLENMSESAGGDEMEAGLDAVDISYFVGEQSELWQKCFDKIKKNDGVVLND